MTPPKAALKRQTFPFVYQVHIALKLVRKYRGVLALHVLLAMIAKRIGMLIYTCIATNRVGRIFGFFVIKFAKVKY